MATSTYLKIDPIKGESTDTKHKDWIEVTNFSQSLSQPMSGPSGTGGRAASRADFSSLTVEKLVDKASPDLNQYCAQGKHIAKLELEVCQETGEKVNYLKYKMENVMVKSVAISGAGSERADETVEFVFGKVDWEYTEVKNDGAAGTKVGPKGWDLEENKPK